MKDWIELLVAFVLGFFMKHLLGTVCQGRLVEGVKISQASLDNAVRLAIDGQCKEDGHLVTNKDGTCRAKCWED